MPKMDGIEATKRIRQNHGAAAPIVIGLTADELVLAMRTETEVTSMSVICIVSLRVASLSKVRSFHIACDNPLGSSNTSSNVSQDPGTQALRWRSCFPTP